MSQELKNVSEQYQIVLTDESDKRFVAFTCNDLQVAKDKYLFCLEAIQSEFDTSMVVNAIDFVYVELQRVEQIEV